MRHGRAKAARKTLSFFARQGVTPPFCVLVDGPFLVQAVVHKVPIIERMEKLLQYSRFTLQVTRSTLEELQVLARHDAAGADDDKRDAIAQARQWGLDECEIVETQDIPKESVDNTELGIPGQDIVKLLESPHAHSYIVATQDEVLLDVLRNSGQCPLLRLSRGVLLLEHPSKAAQTRAQYRETKKYSHSAIHTSERALAKSAKQEMRQDQQPHATVSATNSTRVKRKAKGPNPLSCKKKQSASSSEDKESAHKRKRRRKQNG